MRVFGLSLLAFAVGLSGPAVAEDAAPILTVKNGDAVCIGYEAETHSCALLGLVEDASDAGFRSSLISVMTDFQPAVTTVQSSDTAREGDLYCLVPKTTTLSFDPEGFPGQVLVRMATLGLVDQMEKKGACNLVRRCGSQWASIAHIGQNRVPAMDYMFTLFRAGDPTTKKLTPRAGRSTELEKYMGNVSQECLPVT